MRTTTRSSERVTAAVAAALVGLCGCAAPTRPAELFQLSPESPRHRAAQIRFFETSDQRELLSASAAVLQDLGFYIEESVRDLGFLRASKERGAREHGQEIGRFLLAVVSFGHALVPVDLQQKIAATLVARPVNPDGTRHEVRIVFYRVIWMGDGQSGDAYLPPGEQRMEMIRDPEIYRQFFAKLSKAVFLEAFTL